MVDVVIRRQQTAIVIMAVVVVEGEGEVEVVEDVEACQGGLIIVVIAITGCFTCFIYGLWLINYFDINCLVMVSGLPSSASWQDLKVR